MKFNNKIFIFLIILTEKMATQMQTRKFELIRSIICRSIRIRKSRLVMSVLKSYEVSLLLFCYDLVNISRCDTKNVYSS